MTASASIQMPDENPIAAAASASFPWLRYVLHGVGGGTAVVVGLAVVEAVKQRPEFLPQLLNGNVLIFGIGTIGLVVFDRRLQSYAELHSRSVTAQEDLAKNVGALVAKDDLRAREQDALLGHLARQTERILQYLEEQRQGHA